METVGNKLGSDDLAPCLFIMNSTHSFGKMTFSMLASSERRLSVFSDPAMLATFLWWYPFVDPKLRNQSKASLSSVWN